MLLRTRDVIRLKEKEIFQFPEICLLRPIQQLLKLCIVNLGYERVATVLNVAKKKEQLQEKHNSVF